jgi:5-methylcytosine-specific restriction endonuclease McrA
MSANSQEYNRKYYKEHKKQMIGYTTQWRKRNPQKIRGYAKINYDRSKTSGSHRYWKLLRASKRLGVQCSWPKQEFIKWYLSQDKVCFYCGRTLIETSKTDDTGLTLDRLDNTKAYEPDNVVLCCRRCNTIKGCWLTPDAMKEIAQKYVKYGLRTNRPNAAITKEAK